MTSVNPGGKGNLARLPPHLKQRRAINMTTIRKCVVVTSVWAVLLGMALPIAASEFSLGYDRAGQLRAVTVADGHYETLAYDAPANLTQVVTGNVPPNLDTDGDGLTDIVEILIGTRPDLSDTDGDGMPDGWEHNYGLDPLADDALGDLDGDGLTNYDEYYLHGTRPDLRDTDGDGLPDGWEVLYSLNPTSADADNDGISDADEDADGDGYTNGQEYRGRSDPTDPNSLPNFSSQVPTFLLLLLDD